MAALGSAVESDCLLFDEKILVILALDPYTYVLLFGVINQGHRNNRDGLGS